jgi:hypothetical protein
MTCAQIRSTKNIDSKKSYFSYLDIYDDTNIEKSNVKSEVSIQKHVNDTEK